MNPRKKLKKKLSKIKYNEAANILRQWINDDRRGAAAIFLTMAGKTNASEIFKYLRMDEVETMTFEISRLDYVSKEDELKTYKLFKETKQTLVGGIDYARDVLSNALGDGVALDVINRLTTSFSVSPFYWVRKQPDDIIAGLLLEEMPQTSALVLCHLEPERAVRIGNQLPDPQNVFKRITNMGKVSSDIAREIERVIERKLAEPEKKLGGADFFRTTLGEEDELQHVSPAAESDGTLSQAEINALLAMDGDNS